jgi:hypothetical protein
MVLIITFLIKKKTMKERRGRRGGASPAMECQLMEIKTIEAKVEYFLIYRG